MFFDKANENFSNIISTYLTFSEVRPKIIFNVLPINDFIFFQMYFDNKPISVLGIQSPGLTSALAIGRQPSRFL